MNKNEINIEIYIYNRRKSLGLWNALKLSTISVLMGRCVKQTRSEFLSCKVLINTKNSALLCQFVGGRKIRELASKCTALFELPSLLWWKLLSVGHGRLGLSSHCCTGPFSFPDHIQWSVDLFWVGCLPVQYSGQVSTDLQEVSLTNKVLT